MGRLGFERRTEAWVGLTFLGLMVLFVVLSITTFDGTPTVLLIVGAVIFLAVGLFLLAGPSEGGGASQQQSVVLGGGTISQGAELVPCAACGHRVPASMFCPDCGARMRA